MQSDNLVQFMDLVFDPHPVRDVAGLQMDHLQSAAGNGAAPLQFLVQRKSLEGRFVPRQTQPDDSPVPEDGQPTRIPAAECHTLEAAAVGVDESKPTRTGFHKPQPVLVPSRRMGHRQPLGQHFVGEELTQIAMPFPMTPQAASAASSTAWKKRFQPEGEFHDAFASLIFW